MTNPKSGFLLVGIGVAVSLLGAMVISATGPPSSLLVGTLYAACILASWVVVIFGLVRLIAGFYMKVRPSFDAALQAMPPMAQPGLGTEGGSTLATKALVWGIIGLVAPCVLLVVSDRWAEYVFSSLLFTYWVPSAIAVTLGAASLSRIKRSNGQLPGGRQAIAGMVLGIVALVLYLGFLALLYTIRRT
jgi:hypothetical protein